MPLLFLILAVCIVIIVIIVALSGRDNGQDTETDSGNVSNVSDVTGSTSERTDDTTEGESTGKETETDETSVKDESSDTFDTEDTDDINDTTEEDSTEDTTDENTDTETSSDAGYVVDTTVETEKNDGGDVTIIYPVIDPDDDKINAERLNELIKDYIDQKFKYDGVAGTGEEYTYEITETVTAVTTPEFASIIVKGKYYIADSPSPTVFAYTINCDMKAVAIISATDLVFDYNEVKKLFTGGKFKLVEGLETLLDETNYEDMIMEYRTEYGIYPNVYFTKTGFGMIIDLVNTLGGYALFEIPYSEVEGLVYCPAE